MIDLTKLEPIDPSLIRVFDPNLLSVRPIDSASARRLVSLFHYMKTYPAGAFLSFGIFYADDKMPSGVAVFGKSSGTEAKAKLFRGIVKPDEIIEMQRLWISDACGKNAESKALALMVAALRTHYPKLKVLWTYAGGCKNDCGIVYQSSGFMFLGSEPCNDFYLTSTGEYRNILNALRFGKVPGEKDRNKIAQKLFGPGRFIEAQRHYYFFPLHKSVRRKMEKQCKPFPKESANYRLNQEWVSDKRLDGGRAGSPNQPGLNPGTSTIRAGSIGADASGYQPEEGGSQPTPALQNEEVKDG